VKIKKILFSIMFWVVSCTWGIIMTTIGALATVGLNLTKVVGKCFGKDLKIKTHINGCSFITEVGSNWGGLELGAFALCGNYSQINKSWFRHTRYHEFGHAIQHLYLGPLFIFIVAIPSAIRYWLQRLLQTQGVRFPASWYDSIWFEGGATKTGEKFVDWLEN
jgi:hypothetical protein